LGQNQDDPTSSIFGRLLRAGLGAAGSVAISSGRAAVRPAALEPLVVALFGPPSLSLSRSRSSAPACRTAHTVVFLSVWAGPGWPLGHPPGRPLSRWQSGAARRPVGHRATQRGPSHESGRRPGPGTARRRVRAGRRTSLSRKLSGPGPGSRRLVTP
jgi:hypothetical protein